MTLSEKQQLFTLNVAKLINYIVDQGYHCTFGEVFRTQEQANLNAQHGSGISKSLHCQRLAVDLNIFEPSGHFLTHVNDYRKFGEYWQTLHKFNRWGGCFHNSHGELKPDSDHFEMQDL